MNFKFKTTFEFLILFVVFIINGYTQNLENLSGVVFHTISPEGHSASLGTASYTPFENLKVNQDDSNQRQVEVSIDINPRDSRNIVATWIDYRNDNGAKIGYGYSFDGGQTWRDGILPPGEYLFQGDPAVVADKDGNFFISFISFNTSPMNIGGVYVAKSTDGGITWPESNIARLDENDEWDDKPYIAIDRTNNETANNIYVAWNHIWNSQMKFTLQDLLIMKLNFKANA